MSGIEVAGLLLGALPILFSAVDFSKDSLSRIGLAFKKRKNVEKLARALLLQQQFLEETVKSVVIASGCEDVWRLDDDPYGYLNDESVREEVLDYLGVKNDAAFTGALEQSSQIVRKIAKNITGLVPAFKGAPDDLLAVINSNRDADGMRLDLIPRVKLVFGMNDLKESVRELDDTSRALDGFTRVLLSNRQVTEDKSSKKAIKLAKALRHVRRFAGSLSQAIFRGWKAECHSQHEARLFLEDRIDIAPDILKRVGKDGDMPILAFQLIFAAGIKQQQMLWHETVIQVFDDNFDDPKPPMVSQNSKGSQVAFTITKSASPSIKPEITSISDICSAIEAAKCKKQRIAFVLARNQQIGTTSAQKETIIQCQQTGTTTLKALLSANNTPRRGPVLPWKFRMLLALKLASNLLQLIQTQWLQSTWSKDMVYFSIQATENEAQDQVVQLDLGRPFVTITFDDNTGSMQVAQKIEPKVALLELGILLLEIWHETTLETRFCLEEAPRGYYQRLALGAEWLDDTDNPLPDLYDRAVSYCIQRPVGEARFPDWEDIKFWETVCEGVIEPLSKNCRQWR
ncbi:hypothetical protein F5884DRAFT_317909 [Xylogone sp. PMI_703]|nr:hypothetical protein F5884DRAFT_317909 [Xylogone sp. PMI_703]